MSKRPPGAPRPKEKHVGLLDDTIVILSTTDPTKDQIPEFQRALGTIAELLDAIRHFDSNTFPEGFARRLTNARRGLNEGEPENALALLKRLSADWRDYRRLMAPRFPGGDLLTSVPGVPPTDPPPKKRHVR